MKKIALLGVTVVLSMPALAAPETFVVDSNHTLPRFSYNHLGYSTQVGRFDKVTGKIVLDPVADSGSVDITIDMKSIDTGDAKLNEHLQSPDFFDVAKYPVATFKSTAVKFVRGDPAAVEGELTINGITKPVTLTVTSFQHMMHPMLKKDAIGANATATVKRSEFNAGKYAPFVSDEVTLMIPVEAQQE